MSEVWPRVSGKAPWANSRVVWVATVVFPEVRLPERLRHESVRSRAAVTKQTHVPRPAAKYSVSARMQSKFFLKNTKRSQFVVSGFNL